MTSVTRVALFSPQNVNNASPTTLITVASTPSDTLLINGVVRFINHTGSAVTVTAWAVPSGGSVGNPTIALPTTSIGANSYIDVPVPQIAAGGTFEAQSGSASAITAQPIDGVYYAT